MSGESGRAVSAAVVVKVVVAAIAKSFPTTSRISVVSGVRVSV
jgi:hypothetical protein